MKVLILCALVVGVISDNAPRYCSNKQPLHEDFGYVTVRQGAHMFWVTYATENALGYCDAPLIMWLQGGPGSSGVGYGNFEELGPTDINGNPRAGRWTLKANLMFVDNPVGTGYSYVDGNQYATTNKQIADDLVALVKSVFTEYPEYQSMPFYVFCESYGGKMTADFGLALDTAIKRGEVKANFMGVGLGDSWISGADSVNTWGSYLYNMGFLSAEEQAVVDASAQRTQNAVDAGRWSMATDLWSATEGVVMQQTDGVDFYNILTEDNNYVYRKSRPGYMASELKAKMSNPEPRDALTNFMNSPQQKNRWDIPSYVTWGGQGGYVFSYLYEDFMKPVISSVQELITDTDIHVAVYQGDLDLICDTPGAYNWVYKMNWPEKQAWINTARETYHVSSYSYRNAGYYRRYRDFSLHTFIDGGHMVPEDTPEASLKLIDNVYKWTTGQTLPPLSAKDQKALDGLQKVSMKEAIKKLAEEKAAKKRAKRSNQEHKLNRHQKQIEEPPMYRDMAKRKRLEKLRNKVKGENEKDDKKRHQAKGYVAGSIKSRATPQGRLLHKKNYVDLNKPIFHQ